MLLGQRHSPTWTARLCLALWPRRSFSRSARYAGLRIMRMSGAPKALALGVAVGVFVATLPVPGLQLLLAALLAWIVRGHIAAALLATFWANPLTVPVLWIGAHGIGQWILGTAFATPGDVLAILAQATAVLPTRDGLIGAYTALLPVLKPLAVGGLLLGLACAAVAYAATLKLVGRHRTVRALIAARPLTA